MPDTRFDDMLGEVPTMMLVDYLLRKRPQVVAVKMVKMPQGSTLPPIDGQEFTLVPAVEPIGQDMYPGRPLDKETVENKIAKKAYVPGVVYDKDGKVAIPHDAEEFEVGGIKFKKDNSLPPDAIRVEQPGDINSEKRSTGIKPIDFGEINKSAKEVEIKPTPPFPPAVPVEETAGQSVEQPIAAGEGITIPSPFAAEVVIEDAARIQVNPLDSLKAHGVTVQAMPDGALISIIDRDGRFDSNPSVRKSQIYQVLDLPLGNNENSYRSYLMAAAATVIANNASIRSEIEKQIQVATAD